MVSGAIPSTILIADDHQLFNDGLRTLLTFEGSPFQVVGQVYRGDDVILGIHQLQPDVVLLDINMPHRNGIDVARQIVRDYPTVRVVIISMYNYQKFVDELKEIGVAGYLLKSASQQELISCLQSVITGGRYFDIKLNGKAAALHQEDEFVKRFKLSPRELEIIVLMREGLSAPEIARQLFISEETVKTHRKNIYYKLDINNLAELIRFANEHGL
ncbi:response regulator transcription factor [Spirosoma aureum]|uniref:Response regulator transcription factor n=1 Tax=Spirosoma aureum TaxID=2692134 RepID=A0A6G9AJY8_9BACT|nr:response regulator transcription factor [Spirosoma aureum]QIP12654.1 response regulator transcription factor [Spirosoma aureum]